jgi:hypothetical protein
VPKPPKPVSDIDQRKAGLQGDHDPRDPVQQQNDKPKGDFTPPNKRAGRMTVMVSKEVIRGPCPDDLGDQSKPAKGGMHGT